MLYTTYFSKLKDVPDDVVKLIITRFPPKWLDLSQYKNIFIEKSLSPSQDVLLRYKDTNDWDKFSESFYEELRNRFDMQNALNGVVERLNNGLDVCLVCYEKDPTTCHRSLLANKLKDAGFEWKEI